jgi:hypothetical protein
LSNSIWGLKIVIINNRNWHEHVLPISAQGPSAGSLEDRRSAGSLEGLSAVSMEGLSAVSMEDTSG